jgi:hypothetical protein
MAVDLVEMPAAWAERTEVLAEKVETVKMEDLEDYTVEEQMAVEMWVMVDFEEAMAELEETEVADKMAKATSEWEVMEVQLVVEEVVESKVASLVV